MEYDDAYFDDVMLNFLPIVLHCYNHMHKLRVCKRHFLYLRLQHTFDCLKAAIHVMHLRW